jgi:tetratricopeptide (TPR) repeat protein
MASHSAIPDPARAVDLADFIDALGRLRVWAGQPSYRSLAKRVGQLMRPAHSVPTATVVDVFKSGRRRLDIELVTAIVRALGVDEPGVARWREACARVHTEAKTGGPMGVFRQLPPDLSTFTGREAVLRQVISAAAAHAEATDAGADGTAHTVAVIAVEGMAGVGKTRLAVHAAHALVRAGHFPDAQLYVNLRGFDAERPPADPAEVLDGFLRALQVPSQHIPDGADERAAMFRDRLHGRRVLLLLDNAADEAQIRPLLPASPGCLVLVTSRRSLAELAGAAWYRLGVFDEDEALALLGRIAGDARVGAEPGAALRIVRRCGLLPLAVSVAATRLRSRTAWRPSDLADRLDRGDVATSDIGGAAFDVSYRDLPDRAKRVFRLLGLHPGIDFTAASVAASAGLRPAEAERALEQLLDENLLQQSTAGRYEIHDLLRAYAAERAEAEMSPAERRAAVGTALSWHVAAVTLTALAISPDRVLPPIDPAMAERCAPQARTGPEAVLWYSRERANLMQAIASAGRLGFDSLAWRLPLAMAYFEELGQNYRELERLMSAALPHARADTEPDGETDIARWLAFALSAQGRAAESIGPLQRALEARRAAGDALRTGRLLGSLGAAYTGIGDLERGLRLVVEAIRTIEDVGGPVPSSMLTSAARCLDQLGRPLEALEYHVAFVERARKADDQRHVALGLRNVGAVCLDLGRIEDAAEALEEAAAVAAEVGDVYVQADCLNGLAVTLKARGLIAAAGARCREAVALFDDLSEDEAARMVERLDASSLRYAE